MADSGGGGGGSGEKAAEVAKTRDELEAEIAAAVRARAEYFCKQADNLTLEGVRRALEKDLGMETYSLDAHKRFIKTCVYEFFNGNNNNGVARDAKDSVQPMKEKNQDDDKHHLESHGKNSSISDEKTTGSPVLAAEEAAVSKKEAIDANISLSEDTVKKAIAKRTAYLSANLNDISFAGVRRMLEEDLKVEKYGLDAYKSLIGKEIDMILSSSGAVEISEEAKGTKKKLTQTKDSRKAKAVSKKADSPASESDDILSDDEEHDEEIKGSKKRAAQRSKACVKQAKKQKKGTEEVKSSRKKKPVEPDLEKSSLTDSGNSSNDEHSHSSEEEDAKKKKKEKDVPTQAYGKKVEHLKSIIKSCGMGIPPSVYKRAKQAPESKRESFLIKELEEILEREGLSRNPSEKEIKEIKKKKERAKELEGIDMSNIVATSRRRTSSYVTPPPKPEVRVESEGNESNEDEDSEEEDAEEVSEDDNDDGDDATEGSDEDVGDDSD